jgi:pimeloyl-ACP methyl ester carboxylesterase
MDAIATVTQLTCRSGVRPVFVGANLGGYVGMELLAKRPCLFRAAAIVAAGQNVGVEATWKAIAPLVAFSWVIHFCSSERLIKMLLKDIHYSVAMKRASVDFDMAKESSLGCSVYFQQAQALLRCLRQTNSVKAMNNFPGDIWYAVAAKDSFEQDMIPSLMSVSRNRCASKSRVVRLQSYSGANRFFTHDMKYYDLFVSDLKDFLCDALP